MAASRVRASRSIRARVTAGALVVVAAVLGVGAIATVQILRESLTEGVAVALEQDLETIGDQLEHGIAAVDMIDDDVLVRLEGSGTAVNSDDARDLPHVREGDHRRGEADGEPYLIAAEDTDVGHVTVARSLEHVDEAVATATTLLIIATPLVLLLVGIVVWVVASRALAPVERLRRQVDGIDPADLERRVDPGRDDELGDLARTMNTMLDRIEDAQTTQRRFVSDASHELRSPLATMRQHAELARLHPGSTSLDALSDVVLAEGARMQELVESMLLLARLDEHRVTPDDAVDLDDLVFAEVRRLRDLGIDVDGTGIRPARVRGSSRLLAGAVRNLLDNAARHAEQRVTVRLGTGGMGAQGAQVRLEVEDDGHGIPEERRESVFDRFARLDEGRARDAGGSGLGLAIVREVARAHGGAVTAGEGASGGALFTMRLPAIS